MSKHKASATKAGNEKRWVALTSVLAAVLLTGTKLVVGITTGSLGILSEAAHSALDFVAAAVTYFAVRFSDRPADPEHRYGHGKIESLSALVETVLLLITCVWIVKEAVARLMYKEVHVDATPWAFGVVLFSIIIDVSRSRALMRVAKKHGSQALEADALHFSTDVWSSTVVLLGLALVKYGEFTGRPGAFQRADALAALGVAVIVIHVSVQLGRRTIDVLLDRAPTGLAAAIEDAVREVEEVLACSRVRLRQVGQHTFVDLAVTVGSDTPLERSHIIAGAVEERICTVIPGADVVVHVEPQPRALESATERIRGIAASMGDTVHNVVALEHGGRMRVELHAEMSEALDLARAHERADLLEAAILKRMPEVAAVTVHIEPHARHHGLIEDVTSASSEVARAVTEAAASTQGIVGCHDITVMSVDGQLRVALHCVFDAGLSVADVHRYVSIFEEKVHSAVPNLADITTHAEPDRPQS